MPIPQKRWRRYWRTQKGATAIEYGLIACGVCLAISGSIYVFGEEIYNLVSGLGTLLQHPPTG